MATPSINNLVRYISKKLTGANWNTNFQTIVDWFTDGNTDLNINSLTTTDDVTVGGDIIVTGDVTADEFFGDGSNLTNLDVSKKNFLINGGCVLKENDDKDLNKFQYRESVANFFIKADATTVTSGTITQTTTSNIGNTGFAILVEDVSMTGAGEVYLRYLMYNKTAVNFKDNIGSFQSKVYHDVGSQINYTIYINKADVVDDFSAVTEISNSGPLGVTSELATDISFANVSFGDCSNGIEILIKAECGAITLKNFEFTELQLEIGKVISSFDFQTLNETTSYNDYDKDGRFKTDFNDNTLVGDIYPDFSLEEGNTSSPRRNVSLGKGALSNLTFIGADPLQSSDNIAIGYNAGNEIVSGDKNIAIGSNTLGGATFSGNIAIGYEAAKIGAGTDLFGSSVVIGAYAAPLGFGGACTIIGANAGSTITGYNNIAIGESANVPVGANPNQVRIGDSGITYAGVQVAWTITSDISWKENIEESNLGLNFINQLKPVSYNRKDDDSKQIEYGLIAQDIEKALVDNNIENVGMLLKDDEGKLHLRYNDLIPILIKSVQDQDKKINDQEKRIRDLEIKLEGVLNGNTINK